MAKQTKQIAITGSRKYHKLVRFLNQTIEDPNATVAEKLDAAKQLADALKEIGKNERAKLKAKALQQAQADATVGSETIQSPEATQAEVEAQAFLNQLKVKNAA